MDADKIYYLHLELDELNSTLDYYENSLSKFEEFTKFKRDINIQSILSDNKIQFDIDDMKLGDDGLLMGVLGKMNTDTISLREIAFIIKSMSFILKGNNVLSLKIGFKILKTRKGQELLKFMNSDIELKMRLHNCRFYID